MKSVNGIRVGELPFDREASREYQVYRAYANSNGEEAALRAATDTIVKLRRCLLDLMGNFLGEPFQKWLEDPHYLTSGEKQKGVRCM